MPGTEITFQFETANKLEFPDLFCSSRQFYQVQCLLCKFNTLRRDCYFVLVRLISCCDQLANNINMFGSELLTAATQVANQYRAARNETVQNNLFGSDLTGVNIL